MRALHKRPDCHCAQAKRSSGRPSLGVEEEEEEEAAGADVASMMLEYVPNVARMLLEYVTKVTVRPASTAFVSVLL